MHLWPPKKTATKCRNDSSRPQVYVRTLTRDLVPEQHRCNVVFFELGAAASHCAVSTGYLGLNPRVGEVLSGPIVGAELHLFRVEDLSC